MAIAIAHAFVSGKADPPDASLVKPSDWNANHVLTMGSGKLVGRTTASSGAAEEIAVSGALTFAAQTLSLPAGAITNAYLADMATQTIKGRTTTGTGDPEDLTPTQVTALLDTFTTSLKGLVPPSGGGTTNFLRADGSFAAPPTADAQTLLNGIATARGTLLARGASAWNALGPNTAGFILRDGGVGADPSWVGGMTKISSGTASGAATIDITLPTGYSRFLLFMNVYPSSSGAVLGSRVSYDNGSTFQNTGYSWAMDYGNTQAAQSPAVYSSNDTSTWTTTGFQMSAYGDNTSGTAAHDFIVDITPGSASINGVVRCKAYHMHSGGTYNTWSDVQGNHSTTDIYDAIRILYNTGNINGPWALYGIS